MYTTYITLNCRTHKAPRELKFVFVISAFRWNYQIPVVSFGLYPQVASPHVKPHVHGVVYHLVQNLPTLFHTRGCNSDAEVFPRTEHEHHERFGHESGEEKLEDTVEQINFSLILSSVFKTINLAGH